VNVAQLHLLLNHIPTVGSVIALGVLLLALARRNEHLTHAGLEVLFVIAVLTLPAYVTGVAAQQQLRERSVVASDAIRIHHDAALIGFTVTEVAGFLAWVALWQTRRRGRAARGLVSAVIVVLFVALALMGRAATFGGEIRHPEIRADGAALALSAVEGATAGDPDRSMTSSISDVATNSRWAWPAAEAVHFLGLSLSFGVLLAVNLRILGVMRQIPFADVHRLLPWGMLGFGANLITGMFFFIGQPGQYTGSAPFFWKVVFLMIAGANFLYLTVSGKGWTGTDRGDGIFDASVADKAMAIVSIFSWFAVLYAGRMLPFLGRAF